MRYIFLSISALLLFSGCEVTFKSRADKFKEDKAYAPASACNENEKEAKRLSLAALSKATSIDSASVLKKSRVQLMQEKKGFCYEAVLTYEGWAQYRQELQQERKAIFDRMQKFNNTISYSDKAAAVETLLQEQKAFNTKLDRAEKIAPTMVLKTDIEKSTIEQSINAVPSVYFEINECAKQSNHRCQVGFISNVRDESQKVTYDWDFGDGESSVRKNPLHTYQKLGGYKVMLQVTDENGAKNSVSTDVNVLKNKKAVQAIKPIAHMPVTNAVRGEEIHAYIAKNGQPAESLIKKNASINAYRYGNIWLLAKYDKIKCAVLDGGLGMTLMGYPKQCYWHEKNAANYMIDLK